MGRGRVQDFSMVEAFSARPSRRAALASLVAASAGIGGAGPARAQTSWRMTTEYPGSSISGEGIATFAGLVAEQTGARLMVQPVFDAVSGIKSASSIEAIRNGRIEAADAFAGGLAAGYPLFGLSALPFVAASIDQARRLATIARPAYEAALAGQRARFLFATAWPPSGIWSKRPITSLADLRSLSIRTYDATSTEVFRAAGARAQALSFVDAMPKLKSGEVDAVLSSGDGGAGQRLWEMLPHFTEINYAVPLSVAMIGEASYVSIEPDLRRAVDAAAAATEMRQWEAIRTRLGQNYARMRHNGVEIATSPPGEVMSALKAASLGAIEAWRKTARPEGSAALDIFARG